MILEAAGRVFAAKLPDQAGLKDVAREAGVSHALVTHYFGTYDALVEAVLEKRFLAMRGRVMEAVMRVVAEGGDAASILGEQRKAIAGMASDPVAVRLAVYALLSGRAEAEDFFPARIRGLQMLADLLEAGTKRPRRDIEVALIASLSTGIVWALGKRVIFGALGRKPTHEAMAEIEQGIGEMIERFLAG